MPKLIVTMPAFNAEATIGRAVSSTLRAMPRDSELLILDDKSTDRTLEVLASFNDSRLRVLVGETNVGGPAARCRLLAESDSELVASIDADDLSFPWRFAMQYKALETPDVTFSSAIRFGSISPVQDRNFRHSLRLRPSATTALHPKELPSALLFQNPVWHPSLLAKRSVIERAGGYNASVRHGDDWDLWLRVAKAGARMLRLAVPVIAYRDSPNQASRTPGKAAIMRNNRSWRDSYINLFNSLVESVSLSSEPQPTAEVARIMRIGQEEQLARFRPINRLHFSSFLRSNRNFVLDFFPDV